VNPRVAGASAAAGGQEDALLSVSRAIEAVQCDLNDRGPHPKGSFLFMGSQRGYRTIFYVAHEDGVPNGYAENNRTKEVVRWKARGELLSQEAKAELLARVCNFRHFPEADG
jgi:phage/plasmid primase-like uncharacterized protein